MDSIKAILLGIIQGLTEFLPVSSSGHLVIGSRVLNFHPPGIAFDVFVHLGTLVAVVIVFRHELALMVRAFFSSPARRRSSPELHLYFKWSLYVILATLPAVLVGLFLKETVEQWFSNILITFTMLTVTGTIMTLTPRLVEKTVHLSAGRAVCMGVAQAMAILPGLSRSGSTIFTGMLLGLNRETAARFSFIMSVPAILGATVLQVIDLLAAPPGQEDLLNFFLGALSSCIAGYFAIVLLLRIIRRGQLHWFGYYCFFVSGLGFAWYCFF